MAWTALITQTDGTLITAATWNTQIEDNLTYLGNSHPHTGGPGGGGTVAFLPSGVIAISDGANCPAGWTRVSALDNYFIRGGATYQYGGGAATHTHTVSALNNHTHAIASHTHTEANSAYDGGGAVGDWHGAVVQPIYPHFHTMSGASAANTDTTGQQNYGTSDASSSLPAYITVLFCKKD